MVLKKFKGKKVFQTENAYLSKKPEFSMHNLSSPASPTKHETNVIIIQTLIKLGRKKVH